MCGKSTAEKRLIPGFWVILCVLMVWMAEGCDKQINLQTLPEESQTPLPINALSPIVKHEVKESYDGIEQVWVIEDVFVLWNRLNITMDSAQGKVCYLGDISVEDKYNNVICIDNVTGKVLWQSASGRALVVSSDGVFVSFSNPAGVRKYDINTGNLVWRKSLGGSGSLFISFLNSQVQILGSTDVLWVLDADGRLIKKENGRRIFFTTPEEIFVNLNGIKVYQPGSNDLLWEYIDFGLVQLPVLVPDKLFLRTEFAPGDAYALDRKTGKLLWTAHGIISNVVYSPGKQVVYALRENGDLLAISEGNGEESVIARFTPSPFLYFDVNEDCGYQLAYDEEKHILMIYTGDSRQLFAIKEQ